MIKVNSIQDIKNLAEKHNIPLTEMRFFVGENYTEPKAFGIYEENGEFIVYKNKDNGQRAIRYQGTDEAEAAQTKLRQKNADWWQHQEDLAENNEYVKEYTKEINKRYPKTTKIHQLLKAAYNSFMKDWEYYLWLLFIFYLLVAAVYNIHLYYEHYKEIENNHPNISSGYYVNNDDLYYYNYPTWYIWNSGSWDRYEYNYLVDDYSDWTYSDDVYDDTYEIKEDFIDFSEYKETYSLPSDDYDSIWSQDWDNNYDDNDFYSYDFSDWSSSDTDWSSDW